MLSASGWRFLIKSINDFNKFFFISLTSVSRYREAWRTSTELHHLHCWSRQI
jgi:hypothetical protein